MKPRSPRSWRPVGGCLRVLLCCCVVLAAAAGGPAQPPKQYAPPPGWTFEVAKLSTYRPAAEEVLRPPGGVQGDFDIAKAPPILDFGILPGQWPGAELWSNWGDAAFASDGRFYCSIGDHSGPLGHAYVYRVDPNAGTMEMVVDFAKALGVTSPDRYAPGKIHGPLLELGDGWLYFAGYRGRYADTGKESGYTGDAMLRYHLGSGKVEDLGAPVAGCSHPIYRFHRATRRLYGLSQPSKVIDGTPPGLYVYDMAARKLIFNGGPAPNMARALMLAEDGRAYYSTGDKDGTLVRYDPKANAAQPTGIRVPGDGILRAASRQDDAGAICGISRDGVVFAFDAKAEKVRTIGAVFVAGPRYTATCVLDPAGKYLYYAPGSHGGSSAAGTPVIQLNVRTARRKVLAFLNGYIRAKAGYNLGGTFGTALSADGGTFLLCWNGSDLKKKVSRTGGSNLDFGLCAVTVIRIPASERP